MISKYFDGCGVLVNRGRDGLKMGCSTKYQGNVRLVFARASKLRCFGNPIAIQGKGGKITHLRLSYVKKKDEKSCFVVISRLFDFFHDAFFLAWVDVFSFSVF